jgi:hypothetical protein
LRQAFVDTENERPGYPTAFGRIRLNDEAERPARPGQEEKPILEVIPDRRNDLAANFDVLSPVNGIVIVSLMALAISISGAAFLIVQMY